ncbi:TolB family protein [Puia dinghuensis]|uniref:Biopolymer transporter TolR n=1 Tax=Puia dinghuensis TaxID=1792502 RepID=A0A8J2UFV1_9BACT|nr:PD40 domain-containing protein [Puia dinghuensis]GGB11362.1 hypothetical protein GCM10011511_38700 [Puia dinghuensis]
MTKISLFLICLLATAGAFGQHPVGIFDDHLDIGNPKMPGDATYDTASQVYMIKGGGANIWFNRDEFHFVYKKIKGDFILTADFEFTGDTAGAVGHRKIGWMIRQSTDEGAASANACKHIDGLVVLQWRPYRGMFMRDPEEERFYPKKGGQTIQLQRIGNVITMKIAHPGEPLQLVGSCMVDDLQKDVLAGLFICAHDSDKVAGARVWNVRIDKPVIHPYTSNPHVPPVVVHDVFASRVETIDIADGHRKVLGGFPGPVAPPPGDKPEYSPDKKYDYYSANVNGTTQIWRMRPDGSAKEQLTFDEYHNWFPHVSPDGKWLAFISYPMDIDPNAHPLYEEVMLRLMPLTTPGAARVIAYLYGGESTLHVHCWSPDSKQISLISNSEPAR